MSRQERITQKLSVDFSPSHLEVVNESYMHAVPEGSESHFKVLVVSAAFAGKSRIDRQRMINATLKEELENGLHALSQRPLTPEEWSAQGGASFQSPECLGGSKHDKKFHGN